MMICYRDTQFCSDAEQCANHKDCSRWFSPEEKERADKWWGGPGAPVAFGPFRDHCNKWEEIK